jgi:hypothetical protein
MSIPSSSIANSLARNSTEPAPGATRGSLNTPDFQALVPQHIAIVVPCLDLQAVEATRSEDEKMAAQRIFANHRLHALRQTIEAAPHVGRFRSQPDPRPRCTVQQLETRQADQDSISRTDNNRRRRHASNSGSTIRLQPRRCRSSIPAIGTDAAGTDTSTATKDDASV